MTKLKKIWFWFWISHFANLIIKKKIVIFADFEQKQIKHKTHLGETGYLYIYIFFQVQFLNFFFFRFSVWIFFFFRLSFWIFLNFFFRFSFWEYFFFRFSFWEYYFFSGSVFENIIFFQVQFLRIRLISSSATMKTKQQPH